MPATKSPAPSSSPDGRRLTYSDDESARKLVYLAIRNHETTWKRPMAGWYECLAAFHAHYGDDSHTS
jgi:transposase-like protein